PPPPGRPRRGRPPHGRTDSGTPRRGRTPTGTPPRGRALIGTPPPGRAPRGRPRGTRWLGIDPVNPAPRPRRIALRLYVWALVAGAAVILAAVSRDMSGIESRLPAWAVLTALFAAVEFTDLSFHSARGRVGLS